jgi:hypothetical protein
VVYLVLWEANNPNNSVVGWWCAQTLAETFAVPSDVVEVETAHTPRGTRACGASVTIR